MRAGSRRLTMASQRNASLALRSAHWSRGLLFPSIISGVHILVVTGGIVAHRVAHHRRVAARDAHVERRVARVAVGLVGVRRLPIVRAEVRLRQRHQHPRVVRRAQDLREAQVRAGLAAVVVRVDEVDAETLEAQEALLGRRRRSPRRRPPEALSSGTNDRYNRVPLR